MITDTTIRVSGGISYATARLAAGCQFVRGTGPLGGRRPFRIHVDPTHRGADDAFGHGDRIRYESFRRPGP